MQALENKRNRACDVITGAHCNSRRLKVDIDEIAPGDATLQDLSATHQNAETRRQAR